MHLPAPIFFMNFLRYTRTRRHCRTGSFDLTQHQETGIQLNTLMKTKEKYLPHVIEPSAGVDRIALALLCEAYQEEWIQGGGESSPLNPTPSVHPRARITNGSRFSACITLQKLFYPS